jgi:hypothetical protein
MRLNGATNQGAVMYRRVLCGLGALLLACGAPRTRIGGEVIELPLRDESPRPGKSVRRVGVMWSLTGDTAALVDVPVVARMNTATPVRVDVSGGGCIGADTTAVRVDGLVATIVPYQNVYTPERDQGCTLDLVFDRRTVLVTFPVRGTGRVRVVYRQGAEASLTLTERPISIQ